MKALALHRWSVTAGEAREIQLALRARVELRDRLERIRYVAGADLAFEQSAPITWKRGLKASSGRAIAGIVLYKFPELEEVERVSAVRPLRFPYVPGLLSFREAPALLAAFARLRHTPDLIFIDGHGYAHPRRFGIASHLGVLLNCATIGVAKSLLIGTHEEPDAKAGSWAPLLGVNEKKENEMIGAVLRTADSVRPVFVSQGHRISLESAIRLVMDVADGYRIPRPTREADHYVGEIKRSRASRVAPRTVAK